MSTTIDQKVVEMRFDNRHFENNVKDTMSTLEKFKQKLNLTGASKGLENINTSANKIDMSGLSNAVEIVRSKFSALEVIGITALANITNSAVNAGKRIASALTIDPIKTGFSEYETKINAIQTIMSNTASKGTTMDDVTKTLNELNTYADKTIYNFAEMTRNIGTFTAAGVGLEESASAIQGIANLAAASGSTSQQASTAMYQLSQALASGSVKLMDWNSVVNAGMGGQKFQEALKATAKEHGVAVDKIIKKAGSFRESLKEEWITADILNETLSKFTVDGAKKYADAMVKSKKWTQKQADALMKEAQAMEDAATKVKTFTQLWDTLKESAQSGWAQSWEIIVGNFDEAKELLTDISDRIGGVLESSSKARNDVLQEWKDLGGRTVIVDSLRNTFDAIASVVTPVKEAFREIFPPITAKQLLDFSNGLKNLTSKLILNKETAAKLKSTFKGFFAVIDIGVTFIKDIVGGLGKLISNFTGITGGILGATGSLGDWLVNLRDSIKEGDMFGKVIDNIVGFLQKGIDKIKEFGGPVFKIFAGIFGFIAKIGSNIGKAFSNSLREGDFLSVMNIFNSGVISSILLGFNKFVNNLSGPIENIADILDSVKGVLESYQQDLKANTLLKIASAVGILAASITVLSMIKPENLASAIGAITMLFGELMGAMAIFTKIAPNVGNVLKTSTMLISLSSALLILSVALKIMSTMDWKGMGVGLISMTVALGELIGVMWALPKDNAGKTTGMIKLAFSLVILGGALKILASLSWPEIGKVITVMSVALGEFIGLAWALHATNFSDNTKGMIKLAFSLVVLGGALKILATMSWDDIGRSLTVMTGALGLFIGLAWSLHATNLSGNTKGMTSLAFSLVILGGALKILATMSWDDIGRSLTVMTGALGLLIGLTWALHAADSSGKTALSMIGLATSLILLGGALKIMGSMDLPSLGKAALAMAGSFIILGVAGKVLAPLVPTLLSLAGVFALFGVGMLALGAGVAALSVGLSTGATAIVAGLTAIILGVLGLVPEIIKIIGESISILCQVIIENVPLIAETIVVVVDKVLESLANHTPSIVTSLMKFLIGILQSLRDHLPELIVAAVEVIGAFFDGVVKALKGIDTNSLLQGVLGITLLTGLIYLLSGITALIPGAMLGVLGLGVIIAELSLVLAAIGGLAQIPGLSWLIEEGGNFLQKVGTAIGQFIGGIAGGVLQGVTSSFPQMGTDLSLFMTNLTPFINGAKMIDASVADGVKSLADVILTLTAANILEGLTSWFTGGTSLADFGKELAEFGPYMAQYAAAVAGINSETVVASANAAKALSEMANNLPNSGGLVSFFTGENDMTTFGTELVTFGGKLKEYSDAVVGINVESINASVAATKALSDMASAIPNMGGIVSWFTGDNNLSKFGKNLLSFGKNLKEYSTEISGVDSASIASSTTEFQKIVDMAKGMQDVNFECLEGFGKSLKKMGSNSVDKFVESFKEGTSKASKGLKDLLDKVSKDAESKYEKFTKLGNEVITKFAKGIKDEKVKAKDAFKNAINDIVKMIEGSRNSFYGAGAHVVSGFSAGISEHTWKAEAAARVMAQAALNAAKKALDEHSPSKAFYKVGDFGGIGFVNALLDSGASAYSAGYTMADLAREGLTKAIANISDLVSDNIDNQPTIRPVLDLTEVESRAGYLNSMFNNPSIGVMSNLSAISSGMNSRIQNGANDDVVSAIDKLRKDLDNVGGDTYNIGDITYDDGSNISTAVKDIVRAVRIERRK